MMKRILPVIVLFFMLFGNMVTYGQQGQTSISDSRKENLRKLLDYRYRGGYYSFERLFYKMVTYPEMAAQNCILGIVIASFEVNCDGHIVQITLKNMLKYGIDEQITNFFKATEGQWNKCDEKKYTRFDVPIQFTIEGTETNTNDAILIIETDVQGFDCHEDEHYIEKAEKLLEKGNGKKAMKHIDELIRRNPYDNRYYDWKKQAGELISK